jgi:hypothetical protein
LSSAVPTQQAPSSGFETLSPPPFNPYGPTPAYLNSPPIGHGYTQNPPPSPLNLGIRAQRNRHQVVVLQPGFAWDRESLALLCKIKDVNKKGSEAVVSSGKFPGKTAVDIDLAWHEHRAEARKYYEEVYGKNLPSKQ